MTATVVLLSLGFGLLLVVAVTLSLLPSARRIDAIRDKRVVKAEAEPLMLGAWIKGGGW